MLPRADASLEMMFAVLFAALVASAAGQAQGFPPLNQLVVETFETAPNPTGCASPHLYVKGANGVTDRVSGVFYSWVDPATNPNLVWETIWTSPYSTCTWPFSETDDDGNGAQQCTATIGSCNRCQIRTKCICDRWAAGEAATQKDIPLWYRFTYIDANDVLQNSAPQQALIRVMPSGSGGCPVDFSAPNLLGQLQAQPVVNENT